MEQVYKVKGCKTDIEKILPRNHLLIFLIKDQDDTIMGIVKSTEGTNASIDKDDPSVCEGKTDGVQSKTQKNEILDVRMKLDTIL